MLAPPTSATGSGLWLQTPIAAMAKNTMRSADFAKGRAPSPQEFVRQWPTPTVCGNYNRKGASATSGDGLATAVAKFATPLARDWRSGKASQATHDRNSRPLSEQIGGSLNPTWVEWLMGWPIGWTDLKLSGTDKCRDVRQKRGACS